MGHTPTRSPGPKPRLPASHPGHLPHLVGESGRSEEAREWLACGFPPLTPDSSLALAAAGLLGPGPSLAKWRCAWGLGADGKDRERFVSTSGPLCKEKLLTDCLPIKKVAQPNKNQMALQPISVLAGLCGLYLARSRRLLSWGTPLSGLAGLLPPAAPQEGSIPP